MRYLYIFILSVLFACKSNSTSNLKFEFEIQNPQVSYKLMDTLYYTTKSDKQLKYRFFLNNEELKTINNKALLIHKTGIHKLTVVAFLGNQKTSQTIRLRVYNTSEPKKLNYKLVRTYRHDINDYTQGFEYLDGKILEGTGRNGKSVLKLYDLNSSKILKQFRLEEKFFGEGVTQLNNRIYQLSWTSGVGFVYDATNFKRLSSFRYNTEGWGLANDGHSVYMSTGSNQIYKFDPKNLKPKVHIQATTQNSFVKMLNELEIVGENIYANQYLTTKIIRIDKNSGAVTGILDLQDIFDRNAYFSKTGKPTDVLNGIAYRKSTGTFLVTGKLWPQIFEIKIFE